MTNNTELTREQLIRHKLDLLLRTGQLLVESAADTNRIMRNMKRTAAFLGLPEEHLHIYVHFNMPGTYTQLKLTTNRELYI